MSKIGINDLWTTRPDVAMLLKDTNEGYMNSKSSTKKVEFICPICGVTSLKEIATVSRNGFFCQYCSWEKSFGEKIIRQLLFNLDIDFESEKSFYWSKRKRYDFYLPKYNCIIEVHGAQHYTYTGLSKRSLEEEQLNDNWKMKSAIKNGILKENYIIIDARNTSIKSIKKQINHSSISDFVNLKHLDWNNVYKQAMNSIMKTACELYKNNNYSTKKIAEKLKISPSTVLRYLNIGYEIGLCEKYNWKNVENDHTKRIICITTNELFDSISEAEEKYSITLINGCCTGRYSYRGELNNKPLIWMFYNDYKTATQAEINKKIQKAYSIYYKSSVVCLNVRKVFYNINDAMKFANIKDRKSIFNCCNGKSQSSGFDKNGKHLVWAHYCDYLRMSEEEIDKKLQNIKISCYRKVICMNNKKVFDTMKDACKYYSINMGNLSETLNKNTTRKTCGKDKYTNIPLTWMYYEEYVDKYGEVS